MLPSELVKKVKRIEITTRKMVNDMMSGQYRSHFKGSGVQFSEHRVYAPGDDVRHIDWKVSARTKEPLIKKYEEERELSVFLVVDISASKRFGSSQKLKSEIAAEVGGMLAYAATHTGDRVGALMFGEGVEKIIPPRKGRQHVLRLIRDLLSEEAHSQGTNLGNALDAAGRMMKHSGIVFVISDFITQDYEVQLRRLSRKHDVVAIWLDDDRERDFPQAGWGLFWDPEKEEEVYVDTGSFAFRSWMKEREKTFEDQTLSCFTKGQVEVLRINTREDYGDAIVRFFQKRKKRR